MQEALGLRPVTERRGVAALEAGELKALLARSVPAEDEGRVTGLGYSKLAGEQSGGGFLRETLPGLGPAPAAPAPALPAGPKRPAEAREESREERRERKAARREAKEARHERKHERRERREERR